MMMLYWRLYFEFFKVGLFAVGGGLATLPFLKEMGVRTGWFTEGNLLDLIAVSESTPGAIGVNAATYSGYHAAGIWGGLVATLGLVSPSIIVIILVSKILMKFKESRLVQNAFYGLRPASTGLIAAAGAGVVMSTLIDISVLGGKSGRLFDGFAIGLAAVMYAAIKKWNFHPVVYIAASGILGIGAGYMGLF